MRVKMVDVDSIKPHPSNPRRDHDVEGIARSIKAFGWRQPIVVWEGDGRVLAGHGRLLAARELGLKFVPVHTVGKDEITAAEAAAYRLADNRTAEKSAWDEQALLLEIDALSERERELAGFDHAYRDELEARLAAIDAEFDPSAEWQGMPEFVQDERAAYRSIVIHFHDQGAVDEFSRLLQRPVTDKTRYMWFPEQPVESYADRRWAAAGAVD